MATCCCVYGAHDPRCCMHRGVVGRTPHKCPVCSGRGSLPHDFYTQLGASTSTLPVTCQSCNGGGVIYT